nr:hypothetical protein [Tanacetum cinerariifolium]
PWRVLATGFVFRDLSLIDIKLLLVLVKSVVAVVSVIWSLRLSHIVAVVAAMAGGCYRERYMGACNEINECTLYERYRLTVTEAMMQNLCVCTLAKRGLSKTISWQGSYTDAVIAAMNGSYVAPMLAGLSLITAERGLSKTVSWQGSYTDAVIAAMNGFICHTHARGPEPHYRTEIYLLGWFDEAIGFFESTLVTGLCACAQLGTGIRSSTVYQDGNVFTAVTAAAAKRVLYCTHKVIHRRVVTGYWKVKILLPGGMNVLVKFCFKLGFTKAVVFRERDDSLTSDTLRANETFILHVQPMSYKSP